MRLRGLEVGPSVDGDSTIVSGTSHGIGASRSTWSRGTWSRRGGRTGRASIRSSGTSRCDDGGSLSRRDGSGRHTCLAATVAAAATTAAAVTAAAVTAAAGGASGATSELAEHLRLSINERHGGTCNELSGSTVANIVNQELVVGCNINGNGTVDALGNNTVVKWQSD